MIDTPSPTDKAFGVTKRGFTGHKHLDGTGLIHMNGRAYDPISGRFLSVDPFIQSPENSQSFNPYSYVMNNPLSGVDPSGYVSSKVPVTASVVDTTSGVHIGFIAGVTEEEAKKIFELCENGCNVTKEDGKLVIQASNGHSKETTYYASRVPGSTASGLGGSTSVSDAAIGSELAYTDKRNTSGGNLAEVGFDGDGFDNHGLGMHQSQFEDDASGFYAKLFFNAKTKAYLVAFRGTQPTSLSDWAANLGQGIGLETTQYTMAMDLGNSMKRALSGSGNGLSFTGHSLGGGLASAASMLTGLRATTFNAAGLNSSTVSRYLGGPASHSANSLISAYYVRGDVLSLLQDYTPMSNAAGNRIGINPTFKGAMTTPLGLHMMGQVRGALGH